MRTIIRYPSILNALVWVLLSCALLPARAGVADAPGADLRVDLYTYGPGSVYWERFGHDALVITDTPPARRTPSTTACSISTRRISTSTSRAAS